MGKYKIVYDRANCIGAGSCANMAPESWKMDEDSKATQLIQEFDDDKLAENLEAAKGCPVNVIHIVEKASGKQLV